MAIHPAFEVREASWTQVRPRRELFLRQACRAPQLAEHIAKD
jgi:hypothetical protein